MLHWFRIINFQNDRDFIPGSVGDWGISGSTFILPTVLSPQRCQCK